MTHGHNNTAWVTFELLFLIYAVPVLGLLLSLVLWNKAAAEADSDRRQYQRLGFAILTFAFLSLLAVLALSPLSPRMHIFSAADWFPLLSLAGMLSALTAAVLLAIFGRGPRRMAGPALSLVAMVYCGLTIFAFLAGGAGF